MLKRRLKQAGLPAHYSPHSFRATGITNFLENDGTLEAAQRIADHADSRTTKLYDRRGFKAATLQNALICLNKSRQVANESRLNFVIRGLVPA
jgi:site-specific recombinase XerC